jgi:predicted flap endonuclease-1-like 5' DNA nuclease
MEANQAKTLYIWVHGIPYRDPEVHTIAAPNMDLVEFRDRYVDTSKDYLIIRVTQACDQLMRVDQTCQGQRYHVTLTPVEGEEALDADLFGPFAVESKSGVSLTAIKGIGRRYAALLHDKGHIDSVQELLKEGAAPQGRVEIHSRTGLSPKLILRWVQLADLMRVEGVGSDYSQLLWEAGITSASDLSAQEPKALLKELSRVKEEQGSIRRLPYPEQIADWIRKASELETLVTL